MKTALTTLTGSLTLLALTLALQAPPPAHAAPTPHRPKLTETERSRLRFHLENLWNEIDLLFRNERIDASDLKRQEKEMSLLQIYDRIPMKPELESLQKELREAAIEQGFSLQKFQLTGKSRPAPEPPAWIYTDNGRFSLTRDQVVEDLNFNAEFHGDREKLTSWVGTWPRSIVRLLDAKLELKAGSAPGNWRVSGKAYRFREIQYPELRPRNPLQLLPAAARANPRAFAQAEPVLWSFVERIREKAPSTRELYARRAKFMLNDRRVAFFLRVAPK